MIFLPFETVARIKMETELHPNGRVKSIIYRANGYWHRDNGPSHQEWNDAGALIYESWCQNGCSHRDNGPAYQRWNDAGVLIKEIWCQNGRSHRDNGPAHQEWNDAGELIYESWRQKGLWHRDNGPAHQRWNAAGELIVEEWYQNSREMTLQEIDKILQPVDIMAALRENLPQPIFEEIAGVFRAV
jgi:antitoxin component YwqK of YwqJK toxin-antitoxin module